tara:strand:- start:1662 stop:1823 length:162 start_codon:yes stop_codon:yes gene_type:complete
MVGKQTKPEDVQSATDENLERKIQDLEERVKSTERLLMQIIDKLELDYPGIAM